jgi:hypothetical protein
MSSQPRLPILIALACALFVRALVPAGWMPAPSGGAFAIELCPAAETAPMAHAGSHHGKHDHSHKAAEHNGDCAFSPLLAAFTPADLPSQLPTVFVAAEAPLPPTGTPAFKTGPPALPPPATGPPALA